MSTVAAVRERPIIMTAESSRAIREGRKTQTRRVVNDATTQGNYPASCLLLDTAWVDPGPSPAGNPGPYLHANLNCAAIEKRYGKDWGCDPDIVERLYPRWAVGMRLWVRETWAQGVSSVLYKADYDVSDGFGTHAVDMVTGKMVPLRWRSPIHMPRTACRITLEIVDVRVERLQEISAEDAIAEGMDVQPGTPSYIPIALNRFASTWDALNAKRGHPWESNPWVGVLEFRNAAPVPLPSPPQERRP